MIVVTFVAAFAAATTTFGIAGNVWVLGIVLVLVVIGNELCPALCPRFVAWLDNWPFRRKFGISILAILFCCLYAIVCIPTPTLGPPGAEPKLSDFETRARSASLWMPIIGFSPLFSFGALRESRQMRHLRGDRGITIR